MQEQILSGGRILIVDDQEANVRLLERLLRRAGYSRLMTTTDPRQALSLYVEFQPDLILLDLHMPYLDGFAVMEQILSTIPETTYLPILVLTADVDRQTKERALSAGAKDFLVKPFDHTEVLLRIGNLLETRFLHQALHAQNRSLEEKVDSRTRELRTLFRLSEIALTARSLDDAFDEMVGEISTTTGFPYIAIEMYDEEQQTMLFKGIHGFSPTTAGEPFVVPVDETLSGVVAARGSPLALSNARKRPEYANEELRRIGVQTYMGIPMVVNQRTIGVLSLAHHESLEVDDHLFGFATSLANHVSTLIERMHGQEQIERQLQQLTALRQIDAVIMSSTDLRLTLNILIEQVTAQLNVDAVAISLFHPHTQTLEYTTLRGFRTTSWSNRYLRLGEGYAGRVALERRPLIIPDLFASPSASPHADLPTGEGFVAYCGVPLIAKGQIKGMLEVFHRTPLHPDFEWRDFLEAIANQTAIAIDNALLFENLARKNTDLSLAYEETLEGWSRALDLRDKETEGHTRRVTEVTIQLARAMGIGPAELAHVRRGALLHDIGKMGIPDQILLKPGQLADEEWEIMRRHPTYAYQLLAPIAFLRPALDIPYYHHEKWDGTGYPHGLQGEQIPLAARVFAVVDVWDALRSDRPYREAWPEEQVIEHIRSLAGTHFDPEVVGVFLELADQGLFLKKSERS